MDIEPNEISFNTVISAAEKGDHWEHALLIVEAMPAAGVRGDVITYSSLIRACERGASWERVLQQTSIMMQSSSLPDIICCNNAASALEAAAQWEMAMKQLGQMGSPDATGCSSVVRSCGQRLQWHTALQLFANLSDGRLPSDVICFVSLANSCESAACWKFLPELLDTTAAASIAEQLGVLASHACCHDGLRHSTNL